MFLIDTHLDALFQTFRSAPLTRGALFVTFLGNSTMGLGLIMGFIILLLVWRKRDWLVPFVITMVGSLGMSTVLKHVINRARPLNGVYSESTFSFPSGHATFAMAFFGFVAYYCWRSTNNKILKITALFLNLSIIAGIGLSRLYLGVHYVSDVIGGLLLGAVWIVVGIIIREKLAARQTVPAVAQALTRFQIAVTAAVMVVAVAAYCFFAYWFVVEKLLK